MTRILSAQTLSLVCLLAIAVAASSSRTRKNQGGEDQPLQKRNAKDDQHSSETGHHHHGHHHHGGGGGGGGADHSRGAKYFMYAHQPGKKHYEFGYKRGNDHHTIERYEKAGPKHNFKTKVRWHDAHGGHGEMYWDYNHGPKHHGGDDGHHHGGHYHHGAGHGGHHGHGHGYHSEPVPSIVEAESSTSLRRSPKEGNYANSDIGRSSKFLKRSGIEKKANEILKKSYSKKLRSQNALKESTPVVEEKETPSTFPEVLGFDPFASPAIAESKKLNPDNRNRGNVASSQPMPKKRSERRGKSSSNPKPGVVPKLAYDLDTGRVYDENTDTWFDLVRL